MDWDLTTYFPEFRGPEMTAFTEDLRTRLAKAGDHLANLEPLTASNAADWETALLDLEAINARFSHLASYVGCLNAADATDEGYEAERAALSRTGAEIEILYSRIRSGLEDAGEETVTSLATREPMEDTLFHVQCIWRDAQLRMSLAEETLAAQLAVDGIKAWSRLFDSVAGNLEFDLAEPDGATRRLPISQCRSLMTHEDRAVRQAAFAGGNAAWASVANTLRAALNGISGTRVTLCQNRGIPHFLDVALDHAHTSRETVDALFGAIGNTTAQTHRLLRFKSDRMGLPGIGWCDLEAPLPIPDARPVDWPTATAWVSQAFHRVYPALGDFFDEILEKKWIDWSPRPGKRPGGFCSTSAHSGESRIFMTHNDCAHDLMTLAHEVGHAWHSRVLAERRPFARNYPMTLAECASTFAELVLVEGMLEDEAIDPAIKLQLAAQELNQSATFLLDIPVRFRFEKALYDRRAGGELSVSELNDLMRTSQREIFGDTLIEGEENPLFWAQKGHFFMAGVGFYNFPYTYGYLLSRTLMGMLRREGPEAFLPRYEGFLRETGVGSCEGVVSQTLDRDLTSTAFWEESITSFDQTLQRTEALLAMHS